MPPPVPTEAESKRFLCSIVHIARFNPVSRLKFRKVLLVPEGPLVGQDASRELKRRYEAENPGLRGGFQTRSSSESPSKTRCAAQAEYGRLAAQAYSPSDAMSQAGVCLGGNPKGSTPVPVNRSSAETGAFAGLPPIAAASYRCLWIVTSAPCRRSACRYRARRERRSAGTAPLRPCTPATRRSCRPCREYSSPHRRCRCAGSRAGP